MLLGTFLDKTINIVTVGQGKNLANAIAAYRGKKTCGCDKRKKKINKWHAKKIQNRVQRLIEEIEDENCEERIVCIACGDYCEIIEDYEYEAIQRENYEEERAEAKRKYNE